MKATPVKGTRDYLPKETEIRDFLQNIIMETYSSAGFQRITTPIIEDSVNLDKSEGGENLNLIFKILKRGKKLESALAGDHPTEKELADMGLRYDLTLPLSRYYANNRNELLSPFKVIQMDRVYRAERPQKGRLREFMQCDIDILGEPTNLAEIELILATTTLLGKLDFKNFTIRINDRRILSDIFAYAGFAKEDNEKLAIIFDKQDKIGIDGVKAELEENGFDQTGIDKFIALFADGSLTLESVANVCDASYVTELQRIIDAVTKVSKGAIPVEFCPSLVRGQGYYTGMVFEVTCPQFSGAVAGGGRYDNMVGKFLGVQVPAVGFSIGFERVCGILLEQGYQIPGAKRKIALLYGKDTDFPAVLRKAAALREQYNVTVLPQGKKLGKQLGQLEAAGFAGAAFMDKDEVKIFAQQ